MFRCSLLQPCCHVYGTVVNNHAFCLHESSSQKQLRLSLNYCQAKSGQDHYRVHVKKNMIESWLEQGVQIARPGIASSMHCRAFYLFQELKCAIVYQRGTLLNHQLYLSVYAVLIAAVHRRARSKIRICILIVRVYFLL